MLTHLLTLLESVLALGETHIGCFSITSRILCETLGAAWWLTVVYGPQDVMEKTLFLDELAAARDLCDGAWIVIGDFNLILEAADKSSGRINRASMLRFRCFVDEAELQDLHLVGRSYTWSNERERPTLVRLDRALTSLDWEDLFPDSSLQALASDASDHAPLLLQTNTGFTRKPRFHFECFWPKIDDYEEAVSRAGGARRAFLILCSGWIACSAAWLRSCRAGPPRR